MSSVVCLAKVYGCRSPDNPRWIRVKVQTEKDKRSHTLYGQFECTEDQLAPGQRFYADVVEGTYTNLTNIHPCNAFKNNLRVWLKTAGINRRAQQDRVCDRAVEAYRLLDDDDYWCPAEEIGLPKTKNAALEKVYDEYKDPWKSYVELCQSFPRLSAQKDQHLLHDWLGSSAEVMKTVRGDPFLIEFESEYDTADRRSAARLQFIQDTTPQSRSQMAEAAAKDLGDDFPASDLRVRRRDCIQHLKDSMDRSGSYWNRLSCLDDASPELLRRLPMQTRGGLWAFHKHAEIEILLGRAVRERADAPDSASWSPRFPSRLEGLDESQRHAVDQAMRRRFSCITGDAGTGKSRVLSRIACEMQHREGPAWQDDRFGFVMCTPTARAGVVLKQKIEETGYFQGEAEVFTLCRLYLTLRFSKRRKTIRCLMVDEAGMADQEQLLYVTRAAHTVVIGGDYKQLLSVSPGQFLRDLVEREARPKGWLCELTKVWRGEGRLISTNAIGARRHHRPFDEDPGCFRIYRDSTALRVTGIVETELRKHGVFPMVVQDTQSNQMFEVNKSLREIDPQDPLGQPGMHKAIRINLREGYKGNGMWTFHTREKVMNRKNIYMDVEVEDGGQPTRQLVVCNGDIGRIVRLSNSVTCGVTRDGTPEDLSGDDEAHNINQFRITNHFGTIVKMVGIWVQFEGGHLQAYLGADAIRQHLVPAYSTTVHKAQGGEYDSVVVILSKRNPYSESEMLYTGVTRAQKRVHIIECGRGKLASCIRADESVRNSFLFMDLEAGGERVPTKF